MLNPAEGPYPEWTELPPIPPVAAETTCPLPVVDPSGGALAGESEVFAPSLDPQPGRIPEGVVDILFEEAATWRTRAARAGHAAMLGTVVFVAAATTGGTFWAVDKLTPGEAQGAAAQITQYATNIGMIAGAVFATGMAAVMARYRSRAASIEQRIRDAQQSPEIEQA